MRRGDRADGDRADGDRADGDRADGDRADGSARVGRRIERGMHGVGEFLKRIVRRREPEPEEAPVGERSGPRMSLAIDSPLEWAGTEFIFPSAFAVGATPIRARAMAVELGAAAFRGGPGPWFAWRADTPAGKLGGYWQFPPAGKPRDEAAAKAWAATAQAVAQAAAAALKARLAELPSLAPSSFTAGPCAMPALAGKTVLRLDLRYPVRGTWFRAEASGAASFPLLLARALCAGAMGAPVAGLERDPVGALGAASAAIGKTKGDELWQSRAFAYAGPSGERRYLPLYELFNLLSDADLRLVTQNRLLVRFPGRGLGSLFMYRAMVKAASGPAGPGGKPVAAQGPVERIIPPWSLDHGRFDPCLPDRVLEEGRLDPANASSNVVEFFRRNDEAVEDLWRATRSGSLELSAAGAALIRAVYVGQVWAARRRAFDAAVASGKPGSELMKLPERIARRAVDMSDARSLAAAVYGSKECLAYVARWCSRGKREEMDEELRRIEEALREGAADMDGLMAARGSVLGHAREAEEKERRERERASELRRP